MTHRPPIFDGNEYHPLDHLADFQMEVSRDNWSKQINVSFSWHCYTRTPDSSEDVYLISDKREGRCFCSIRYKYSFLLPEIIKNIFEKTVYQTGKGNFVYIELVGDDGVQHEYGVFFQLRRQTAGKPLRLFVESAYPIEKSKQKQYKPKNRQKIRFRVLAYNIINNRPIRFNP